MNLNYYYDPIYWSCACLNVNANAINEADYEFLVENELIDIEDDDEEENKSGKVAYDKVAEAISKFTTYKIVPPDINNARMGFIPKVDTKEIMFGLKGLNKIGDDLILEIINNRPYTSLNNFIEKMTKDGKKLISKDRIINLIKAGCFDAIEDKTREEIMNNFINDLVPYKATVNLRNVQMITRYGLFPPEMNKERGTFIVHNEIKGTLQNGFYCIDDETNLIYAWILKYTDIIPIANEGHYFISQQKWDVFFKKEQDVVRKWIKENVDDLIEKIHQVEYQEQCDKYAKGDKLQWELDSMNFYHSGHPLKGIKFPFAYDSINDLIENDFDGYWNIKGQQVPKMRLKTIIGTVLIKNKKQNIITLSTPNGVIKLKCYKQSFAKYDKVNGEGENIIQDSFFEKGTHLRVIGILRDGMFIPKVYKNLNTEPIEKINIENGKFVNLEVKK